MLTSTRGPSKAVRSLGFAKMAQTTIVHFRFHLGDDILERGEFRGHVGDS